MEKSVINHGIYQQNLKTVTERLLEQAYPQPCDLLPLMPIPISMTKVLYFWINLNKIIV